MHRTLLLVATIIATSAPAFADDVSHDVSKPQTKRIDVHRFAQILTANTIEQLTTAPAPDLMLPHQSYVTDLLRSETHIDAKVVPSQEAISANLEGGEG